MNKTIDDELIRAAQVKTGETDERAAVEKVLRDATTKQHRPIDGMLDLAGKDLIRDDYDYKKLRSDEHDPD